MIFSYLLDDGVRAHKSVFAVEMCCELNEVVLVISRCS